jgi:phospholipid/cholesterol/gamma-HCH transport system permease protein
VSEVEDGSALAIAGPLNIHTVVEAENLLERSRAKKSRSVDLSKLGSLDTPGALFLCRLRKDGVELTGVRTEHQSLLDLICALELKPLHKPPKVTRWRQFVMRLGKGADEAWQDGLDIITFVGRAASATGRVLLHPGELRMPSISRHIEEAGINALPLIALVGFMSSVVIGYQAIAQLRPYGGEDFTINLVAVSVLREVAVLITAIMVAGRSGSAFTAEIGVMKSREEIDALNVMGIDPMQVLVVPRLIALVIALPLLTFFADVMGLLGGAVISHALLDVSPLQFLERVHKAADVQDLFVGLIKAPVFAFFIAIVGCMHGLRVKGSAESIGTETTSAVVKAIFLVLMLDALFSVLFEKLGI